MRYVCLIYLDEVLLEAMPPEELQSLVDESLDYDDVLRRNGHFLVSDALASVQTATTIRVRASKVTTIDGPFAETREQLGGFIMIEAKNLDEAIRVASGIPPARVGSVEVRPVMELTHSERSTQ